MTYIIPTANIRVTEHLVWRDRRYCTYKWEGPAWGILGVSHYLLDASDFIEQVPYPLKLIQRDAMRQVDYYVRTDGRYFLSAAYWAMRENLWWVWAFVFSRFLLTLEIWGLAYNDPGQIMGWHSLKNIGKRNPMRVTAPFVRLFGSDVKKSERVNANHTEG